MTHTQAEPVIEIGGMALTVSVKGRSMVCTVSTLEDDGHAQVVKAVGGFSYHTPAGLLYDNYTDMLKRLCQEALAFVEHCELTRLQKSE